ncbi:MAG: hypothetical protein ACK5IN_01925 [Microbacterium sp.]|uniref:hypothetical protein n=1 Tax=Microbacterium sp. TaxID=51671 RepID=UPI003A8ABE29
MSAHGDDPREAAAHYRVKREARERGEEPNVEWMPSASTPCNPTALERSAVIETEMQQAIRRVVEARRQLLGGPPMIMPTRDVDTAVAAWHRRRDERRRADQAARQRAAEEPAPTPPEVVAPLSQSASMR